MDNIDHHGLIFWEEDVKIVKAEIHGLTKVEKDKQAQEKKEDEELLTKNIWYLK